MNRSRWFAMFLIATAAGSALADPESPGRWRTASNEEAWKHLPRALTGGTGAKLPAWARATARDLPRTTAAMLELDRLHRMRSPLGPSLRGKMRWVAADANRCEYTRATALADLRRAGVSEAEIAALKDGPKRWPDGERDALGFALQMTQDASLVTDAQVADLTAAYGEEEARRDGAAARGGELPGPADSRVGHWRGGGRAVATTGREVRPQGTARRSPITPNPAKLRGPAEATKVDDPAWREFDFDALQIGLRDLKASAGRVRVPTYDEVLSRLPEGYPKPKNPIRIRWSLVCMGYQPELAAAWSACTRRPSGRKQSRTGSSRRACSGS